MAGTGGIPAAEFPPRPGPLARPGGLRLLAVSTLAGAEREVLADQVIGPGDVVVVDMGRRQVALYFTEPHGRSR